ncbi:MAG: glycosyltransferase family 4 protein [Planctomycetota bacterium]|nr:glycosyltransferase family 4 protein [Planctomycetota bacterium]
MRILYVSQYYPPEVCAPAVRVSELAKNWAGAGHDVTVLTGFAHHPHGRKKREDRYVLTRREQDGEVEVIRSYVWASANEGTLKRMISYASFCLSSSLIGTLRCKRPDVVIATSPQLLCGLSGYLLSKLLRCRFVFEVRDLWPESILAVSAMKENFVVRRLKGLASFLYRKSDRIVTVGNGYRNGIVDSYGIPKDKIDVVPNGIDTEKFSGAFNREGIRKDLGWQGKFVVLYIGTHGMAHALDKVLLSAKELAGKRDIHFAFVGDGAERKNLERQASELGLDNVQFFGMMPREEVPNIYAACDAGIVSLRKTELFQHVLPSKIFEFLAMGKPIVLSVDGEARRIAEASGAGFFVEPEDYKAMARKIQQLHDRRDSLNAIGEKGRKYVLANFDRSALAHDYLHILDKTIQPQYKSPELTLADQTQE